LADYDSRWAKSWSDDIEISDRKLTAKNYKDVGRDCIEKFYRRHHPFNAGTVLGLEKPISHKLDDKHGLSGYIDRLMQASDGVYEIHDYKTGKHLPTQDDVNEDRQLGLYELAVRHEFPDAKEVRLIWHYLRFDKQLVSVRTEKQRQDLLADTLKLIHKIESAKDFPATESKLCGWCDYYDICPAKGHRIKAEKLPPNRFLKEPGVKLVNKLAKAKTDMKEASEKAGAEIAEIEEAILAFAKKHKLDVVVGSEQEAYIKRETKVSFPGKDDDEREELEAVIRKAGKWNDVAELSTSQLKQIVADGSWPAGLLDKVRKFQTTEKTESVRTRKRSDN
jgi:putative RecB family exonuclease